MLRLLDVPGMMRHCGSAGRAAACTTPGLRALPCRTSRARNRWCCAQCQRSESGEETSAEHPESCPPHGWHPRPVRWCQVPRLSGGFKGQGGIAEENRPYRVTQRRIGYQHGDHMLCPRHGRGVHRHAFRGVIAGDRADRAIDHSIDPHFAVVVDIALEKDPIAGDRLALHRLGHGETEPIPGKRQSYGAALLDIAQRPAGIIIVRQPSRTPSPLSDEALIRLSWHQARRDTPPCCLDHLQVVFVLQIQRNSGHRILSFYRGAPMGSWTHFVHVPPCAPGTPVWGIVPRKASGRVAYSTHTDASSGLERRSLTARAARPYRIGLSRYDRYDVGARDGPASDACS